MSDGPRSGHVTGGSAGGFRADPDELAAFAARLDEAGDEVRAAAAGLAEPAGDLGPEGLTEAVEHLVAEWARVLAGADPAAEADALRAAGDAYRQADELRHD
ncbi:hypothetical protein ACFFSW_36930 [Saccharothrix longispora]|uniref:Intracellular protease/amidase n=1 Tax=Saccharothrix longispora TaxID=33920 RepID=A0ABU1PXX8_9PSEU|nr:hypothetical protein [Saccharothrix longispora]MDR6595489.1 putative intracellular protease/amidase [Saccharothrix longispora]